MSKSLAARNLNLINKERIRQLEAKNEQLKKSLKEIREAVLELYDSREIHPHENSDYERLAEEAGIEWNRRKQKWEFER